MSAYCYINGKILPTDKAILIRSDDIGLLRGYAINDAMIAYGNHLFLFDEHYKRFSTGAKKLHLKVPVSKKEFSSILKKLVAKGGFKESTLKIYLTGGKTKDGLSYDYNSPTFYILLGKLERLPARIYAQGGKLITYEHQRQFPEIKTTNYITSVILQQERIKKGAVEILYFSDGKVREASTSNFFMFKGNTLITPKKKILLGTTRNVVLTLAKKKFKIEERDISLKELKGATEAFITSTYKEVLPITYIDGRKVGKGIVGENVKYLMKAFENFVKNHA